MNFSAVISDSACLIGFRDMGELDLLRCLFSDLFVTPAVSRECGLPPPDWILVEAPQNVELVAILRRNLGEGESEAMVLALEKDLPAIIDDRRARREAQAREIKILGTLGVLSLAKTSGHIHQVRPLLNRLLGTGFRLSGSIKSEFLRQAGEEDA